MGGREGRRCRLGRSARLSPEADQLLKVMAIKGHCRQANVAKIDVGPKGAVVAFHRSHRLLPPLRPQRSAAQPL